MRPNSQLAISSRRRELGLTQAQAAVAAGISERSWHRFESEPGALERARNSTLEAIAGALGWPISRLHKQQQPDAAFLAAANLAMIPEITPGESRAAFAAEITRRRVELGLSIAQAANHSGLEERVWRDAETGTIRLRPNEFDRVRRIIGGGTTETPALDALWRASRTLVYDMVRLSMDDNVAAMYLDLLELERSARQIDWNAPQIIPGFLQTPDYASALCRETTEMSEAGIKRATDAARKRVDNTIFGDATVRVLLHEAALRPPFEGPVVDGQESFLRWMTGRPGIEIRVADQSLSSMMFGTWGIYDRSVFHAHNLNGAQTNAQLHIVEFFGRCFDRAWGAAPPLSSARGAILDLTEPGQGARRVEQQQ